MTTENTENTEHIKLHKRQKRLTGLKIHWLIFILVNLILFVINYFTNYSNMWHFYPLMGWAVATLIHTAALVANNRKRHHYGNLGDLPMGYFLRIEIPWDDKLEMLYQNHDSAIMEIPILAEDFKKDIFICFFLTL